jgi:F-type H+-transporting ATPase subunit gamma
MPQSSREIRRRIKSVKNIGQITKAMELVSASKMRKAQMATSSSRSYAKLSSELLKNLLDKVALTTHPILQRVMPEDSPVTPQHKALIILITSDKGLAGALNTNAITAALNVAKGEGADRVNFVSVGKKGTEALRRAGQDRPHFRPCPGRI